jgi:flagellar hook-length control protein FliK
MIAPPNPLTPGDAVRGASAADPSIGRETAFQDVLGQKIGAIATAHETTGSGRIRASDRQDPRTIASTGLDMVHNPTAMAVADLSSAAPLKATVASAERQQTTPSEPAGAEPRGNAVGSSRPGDERPLEGPPKSAAAPSVDRPASTTLPAAQPDQPSRAHVAEMPNRVPTTSSKASTAGAAVTPVLAARTSAPAAPGAVQAISKIGATTAPRPQAANPPNVPAAIKAAAALDKAARALGKQPTTARLAPDEQKIAAQAARGLAAALRQGGGSVTLRLQPDALGELKVKLDLTGTKVGASFEVGSDQARKLLDTTLTTLRSALEARGLQVDRLEVRVADRPGHVPQPQDAGRPFGGADHGGAGSGDRGMPERDASGHGAGFGMGRIPPAAPSETGQAHGARPGPEPTVIQTGGVPLMRVRLDAVG